MATGVGDFRGAGENEPQGIPQSKKTSFLWLFALPQPHLRAFLRVENLRRIRQGEEKIFINDGC